VDPSVAAGAGVLLPAARIGYACAHGPDPAVAWR
jgi:hypothetical protein